MENNKYHIETLALHAGQQVDSDTLSRALRIITIAMTFLHKPPIGGKL